MSKVLEERKREASAERLVARTGERIAGSGIMEYGLTDAHLALFAVHPDQRREGLGRRILEWLEQPALAGGLSVIWLEVRASNRGQEGQARTFTRPGAYSSFS